MTNLKFIIIKVGQNYFSSPYYAGLDSIASKKVGYSDKFVFTYKGF